MSGTGNLTADGIFTFVLPPSAAVENIEAVAKALQQSLPPAAAVVMVDAKAVDHFGTPAIQFLVAAAKTCEQHGLVFLITNLQPAFRQAFSDAGLAAWLMQREAT